MNEYVIRVQIYLNKSLKILNLTSKIFIYIFGSIINIFIFIVNS